MHQMLGKRIHLFLQAKPLIADLKNLLQSMHGLETLTIPQQELHSSSLPSSNDITYKQASEYLHWK